MRPRFTEFNLAASPIDPGLTVIEASAGTGKTYSISHLVARLLLTGVLPEVARLLLVTFTNDAARELADRTRQVLTRLASPPPPDEPDRHAGVAALRPLLAAPEARLRLERALLDLDLLAVSTIHAFCQRTLQAEGSLCGVPVMPEVITDDHAQREPLLQDGWLDQVAKDPTLAALATAHSWDPGVAGKLLDILRTGGTGNIDPMPAPFPDTRRELDRHIAALRKGTAAEALSQLVASVPAWNKGATSQGVAGWISTVAAGASHTVDYWAAVSDCRDIPGLVTARGAGKSLKAQIAATAWLQSLTALLSAASALEWSLQHEIARSALPRLTATLESARLITQDGLIETLHRALHRTDALGAPQSARLADHLAAKYTVALIDESQDTDPRQFAIFQRIFLQRPEPRCLILVGDPKQAIYGFRGADVGTYLAARNAATCGYTLTHTYRAPQPLVDAVNRVFQRPGSFHHSGMLFRPATSALTSDRQLWRDGKPCSRLEVWLTDPTDRDFATVQRRTSQISARVASTIIDLLAHGELRTTRADGQPPTIAPITCRDFAVLVSDHRQAAAMAEALEARGIPAVVNSGADVFASEEAAELLILLRAIAEPRRVRRVRAALTTRLLGFTADDLKQLDSASADVPSRGYEEERVASAGFDAWSERFQLWSALWQSRGLAALLAELERPEVAVSHRLAVLPLVGERRATNYRQVTDLLLEASRETAPRPLELVRWLGQQIARAELRTDAEEHQLQLSTDRAAVQVVTMHKAKGLEYPLVFCPYVADSLKEPRNPERLRLATEAGTTEVLVNFDLLDDAARAQRKQQRATTELEERLRLAYVALTRAQVRVWTVSYSPSPKSDLSSPLDWLLRTDAEVAAYSQYDDPWVDAAKAARPTRHRAMLESIGAAEASPPDAATTAITFRPPPAATTTRYVPPAGADESLHLAAEACPAVPAPWRVTSFSGLTKEKHSHGRVGPVQVEPDVPIGLPVPSLDVSPSTLPLSFFHAPGGAAIGTAVHDWIETWDFTAPDRAALARHATLCRLPAVADLTWESVLADLFSTLRQIHLPGCNGTALAELCPAAHASEWHFHLPLARTTTVADLARCFAEHAAPAHRPYAAHLGALGEEGVTGLLQGFIDRLVRHEGAWGVIDWKTNHLGSSLADYSEQALLQCAMEDHYLLQTHLYLVALRRYVRALGIAAPEIRGAWLVFLRGIAPGQTRGVLHIAPPAEMLDALDAWFAPGMGGSS